MTAVPHTYRRRRRWLRLWTMVGLGGALAAVLAPLAFHYLVLRPLLLTGRYDPRAFHQLASDDPSDRRAAAARAAEIGDNIAAERMIGGLMGDEMDPQVRLAYVAALSRIGGFGPVEKERCAAILEFVAELDPAGAVRAEAWAALAQLDRQRFHALVGIDRLEDPWRRIGVARALLAEGDWSGVRGLVEMARSGAPQITMAAWGVLEDEVRPALERAGLWPDGVPQDGAHWSEELCARVLAACEPRSN